MFKLVDLLEGKGELMTEQQIIDKAEGLFYDENVDSLEKAIKLLESCNFKVVKTN